MNHDGDNTNNRFLAKGHGPNSNKISHASYTSYTSHSGKDDGAIGKNEYTFKSKKEITTEIENSGSVSTKGIYRTSITLLIFNHSSNKIKTFPKS